MTPPPPSKSRAFPSLTETALCCFFIFNLIPHSYSLAIIVPGFAILKTLYKWTHIVVAF